MFQLINRSKKNTIEISNETTIGIFIEDPDRLLQLNLVGLSVHDLQLINSLKPYVERNVVEVVAAFYHAIESVPALQKVIQSHSSSERLRQTLRHHIIEMFEGRIDEAFLEKRRRVAKMHVKINLYPKWYLAAFQILEKSLRKIVYELRLPKGEEEKFCDAISKICNFEQQIVLEEYDSYASILIETQRNNVRDHVKDVIGGISTQLEVQSQTTTETVTELVYSAKRVNASLKESMYEAESMQKVSNEGYTKIISINEQTGKIHHKTVEMANMVEQLDASS